MTFSVRSEQQTEEVARTCSMEKTFFKFSQNSLENI